MKRKIRVKAHVRRIGRHKVFVKRHSKRVRKNYGMVWDIERANKRVVDKEGNRLIDFPSGRNVIKTEVKEMSPDEFLQIIPKAWRTVESTFYDTETETRKPFSELQKKIEDPNVKVPLPFLSIDREGKLASEFAFDGAHRVNLAKQMGLKKVSVVINTVGLPLEKPISRPAEVEFNRGQKRR